MQSLVRYSKTPESPSELTINAMSGLGGGGLATPQVSNITTAITYAMLAICMSQS